MFNQQEMQLLISGTDSPIDIEDLKSHTQYGGVFDENEETIQLFWKAGIVQLEQYLEA
jgi:ubiquitin-protein ligase E3 C